MSTCAKFQPRKYLYLVEILASEVDGRLLPSISVAVFDDEENAQRYIDEPGDEDVRNGARVRPIPYYSKKKDKAKTKRIEHLTSSFGNSPGETSKVVLETEKEVYYYDGFHRYCYVEKALEGKEFVFV